MPKMYGRLLLLFLVCSSTGWAQQQLYGRIIKKGSREMLPGVNVRNASQEKYNESDMGGNFKIPASTGDTLVFTSAGYRPDTVIVAPYMFDESFLVPLTANIVALATVEVDEMTNYEQDSLKRREAYGFIFDRKHPVKLMNEKRPADQPGLNFSPIGYFSTGEKQKRRLEKRLEQQEKEYYIDYKFSPGRVAQLTRLKDDSLHTFMLRYRPSYNFCRTASSKDILLYINEKLKLYKKAQESQAK